MPKDWVERLAEDCQYISFHANNGGGMPVVASLSKRLEKESKRRQISKDRLTELVIAEWRRKGIIK